MIQNQREKFRKLPQTFLNCQIYLTAWREVGNWTQLLEEFLLQMQCPGSKHAEEDAGMLELMLQLIHSSNNRGSFGL